MGYRLDAFLRDAYTAGTVPNGMALDAFLNEVYGVGAAGPPTTAVTVAQSQAVQEQQAAVSMKLQASAAEDQVVQEEQASASMSQSVSVGQEQAPQEQDADAEATGGPPTTAVAVAQEQAVQEQDAELTFGAPTIPGRIPSPGQYTYTQQRQPSPQRARPKQARPHHGLTIPDEWPSEPIPVQAVTECSVHQEQPPGQEQATVELGAIWRPFKFTPAQPRSTIGAYRAPARAAGGARVAPPARPRQIPQPTRRRKSAAAKIPVEDDAEAIATAVLALLGRPR